MEEETKDPDILETMWGDEVDFASWPKEFRITSSLRVRGLTLM